MILARLRFNSKVILRDLQVAKSKLKYVSNTVPAAYFSRMRICPFVRVCVCACLSLCMRHKNEFGTQMKNTHTDLIRIRICIRDAHTQLVKNTLRALY